MSNLQTQFSDLYEEFHVYEGFRSLRESVDLRDAFKQLTDNLEDTLGREAASDMLSKVWEIRQMLELEIMEAEMSDYDMR